MSDTEVGVILIGGANDGKRILVQRGIPTICQGVPQLAPAVPMKYPDAATINSIEYEVYHREVLRCSNIDYDVYLHNSIHSNLLVLKLMDGYRRPTSDN